MNAVNVVKLVGKIVKKITNKQINIKEYDYPDFSRT